MMSAPINIFQKLMQKWEAVHPYNAAQVMELSGPAERNGAKSAWNAALIATGLGRINRQGNRYTFAELNGHSEAFGVSFPVINLTDHLSVDLNRPFADPMEPPFRPFVIEEGDHYFAGVVYQHWIADSAAIRMLMKEWFVRMYDPASARNYPLKLPSEGYWNTVGPHRVGWDVGENTLGMIRRHTRLRRAQKIDSHALSNHETRFQLFEAPENLIQNVRRFAAARKVKVNDVFLASLAVTCAGHVPLQRRKNRIDVAVGSIADLRGYCPVDLSNTFGLFLAFTNVITRPNELNDFEKLVQVVASQTRMAKQTGVAPSSLIWMSAAMAIGMLSRPDELYHFYRKELPLAAGLSNVDLTHTWIGNYAGILRRYIRVSPTGPMTPLVLTTTTLGTKFHLGLTHRVGLIPPQKANEIGNAFLNQLIKISA